MDTEFFEKAVQFALKAHSGQKRKGTNVPYLLHPFETATIVATMSDDINVIAAALLHDTVEDTEATIEEIEKEFGTRVKELVESETEDKRPELPKSVTWKIRKEESIQLLNETKDLDIKRLWLADKLSNMRSFYRSYQIKGNDIWNAFNEKDPREHKWYYTSIEKACKELEQTSAYEEYSYLLETIFKDVE